MTGDQLIVFLREPRPGAAKSRLAAALGAENAALLYRLLAEEELRRVEPRTGEYARLLLMTPDSDPAAMDAWLPGEPWGVQRGTDLGERMACALEGAFARGARRAVLVGSDLPFLSREAVTEALGALATHDVVFGPAADGGYYLIALASPQPALLRGIAWGTGSVLAASVERARTLGLSVRLLDVQPDVDTLDDVRRLWPRLEPLLARAPELLRAVRSAGGV